MKDKKAAKPRQRKLYNFYIDESKCAGVTVFPLNSEGCEVDDPNCYQIKGQEVVWKDTGKPVGDLDKLVKIVNPSKTECWNLYTFNRRLAYSMLLVYRSGFKTAKRQQAEKIRACLREPLDE